MDLLRLNFAKVIIPVAEQQQPVVMPLAAKKSLHLISRAQHTLAPHAFQDINMKGLTAKGSTSRKVLTDK